ncbi:MAG TPA: alpha-1,4-glucan--maltose-1-phosphate maltosyltransferase [Myxococcales bacterium]
MIDQVRIVIENATPAVDGGRFPVKAVQGDTLEVSADVWKDGHELLKVAVMWRKLDLSELKPHAEPQAPDLQKKGWKEAPLQSEYALNDRWFGKMTLDEVGPYVFTVVAWTDFYSSWAEELRKKMAANQDVTSELLEGVALMEKVAVKAKAKSAILEKIAAIKAAKDNQAKAHIALSHEVAGLMEHNDPRFDLQAYDVEIPVWADREKARFGAWYEMFPRSCGTDPKKGTTFKQAEHRLEAIAKMGFDTVYLPPIHPIGTSHRKGPNNSETCNPGDPGSPWAIGAKEGGHTAVHPDLGTLADFDHFLAETKKHGMEIALDIALQCAPDHPWVKEHPAWFSHRPDGTIKYAENPPKKYQDIYPINFETEDREGLYAAVLDIFLFWAKHGVRIFRVDNPHTKAQSFWEWIIVEVHKRYPDALFLAEAFTRPKRMRRIAKVGFTQSYTYFTWRNGKKELEEYCNELFNSELKLMVRPNFFTNTPDILHEYLQKGGRAAFMIREVLAATLSPSYGIYSGFELCENVPVKEGSEEYLDSEKYQVKVRDWDKPGNIKPLVTAVNRIRREHKALQLGDNLRFLPSSNPNIVAFSKATPDYKDVVVTVVNVDPYSPQEGMVTLFDKLFHHQPNYLVCDLLTNAYYTWHGQTNYVRLDPRVLPAHVLHVVGGA